MVAGEPTPPLYPITDNGLREAKDREKAYLSELVKRLNDALGKDISDTDQVALAVHVSEKLRGDATVMAQVQNNPKRPGLAWGVPARDLRTTEAGGGADGMFGGLESRRQS